MISFVFRSFFFFFFFSFFPPCLPVFRDLGNSVRDPSFDFFCPSSGFAPFVKTFTYFVKNVNRPESGDLFPSGEWVFRRLRMQRTPKKKEQTHETHASTRCGRRETELF
eukprot:TRINITY_DN14180_c2_g1_i1.p2 TRINITY_DN14180_c2_g1~~TRINITY_DN14180_c2_g1_i1.p2  ORF type:complete len:109 (+),score=4.13 TRINITY_DN14180_c2_g1_i1:583-909(+)